MSLRLYRIILSHALTGFICWYGVEKIFEKSIGISTLGISILAVTYITTSAVLNVPTGILADKYGRKYAILLASGALLLSSIVGGLSHSYWQYLIATVLWGIFYTTQNGAYESILYDTLQEESHEAAYARYSGLSSSAFWLAIFVSSVVGAWAGSKYGLRTAYFLTIIPNILNVWLVLSLHEPRRAKVSTQTTSLAMISQGFRFLRSSPRTFSIASVYLLIALVAWTTNEFGQLFFIELGFSVIVIGLLNAFSGLAQSIGNLIGHRFGRISARFTVVTLMALFGLTFALPVSYRYLSSTLFLLLVLIRNIFYIANNSALHHSLPSSIRATTISSLGMMNDGLLIIGYLSFGLVSRASNVRLGYLAVAVYGLVIFGAVRLLARSPRFQASYATGGPPVVVIEEVDSVPR
ncbi:MAG: MFS transporter [Candidatus Saccharibacteria bacterium]